MCKYGGLLQSFKYKNSAAQIATCGLVGFTTKRKGQGRNNYWKSKQTLWWQGKSYVRKSKEYQNLLNRAYNALSTNKNFMKALNAAGDKTVFTHKIEHNNRKENCIN